MDIAAVRAGLGRAPAQVRVGSTQLNCLTYTPTSVSVPCFYPAEIELKYADPRGSMNGEPVIEAVCMVLTAELSADQEGQALLDAYLTTTGATSIKAAIEADKTLGGVCGTLHVHDIDGYRLYTVGQLAYYGARFRVLVLE